MKKKKKIAMTQTDNEKNPPKTLNNPTVCFILSVTTFAKEDVCLLSRVHQKDRFMKTIDGAWVTLEELLESIKYF